MKLDLAKEIISLLEAGGKYNPATKRYVLYDSERAPHRTDGPAIIGLASGLLEWMHHGRHHRLDGPAITDFAGYEFWYKDGLKHREGGPAAIYANGTQEWYSNGKIHRLGGPAVIGADGHTEWWEDGVFIG